MLEFQNTRQAVFAPGLDTDYFDGLTLAETPPRLTSAFAWTNAWWLAELSRVMYRRTATEAGATLPDRRTVLENAGLTETLFVSRGATQAAIIATGACHVLVFRGTEDLEDWLRNAEVLLVSWDGPGKVHAGFLRALNEVWDELHPALQEIGGPIFYTGHSLGGAIAVLASARPDAARRPLAVYTFGGPRCGNDRFADEHPLRDRIYRIVNHRDLVPRVPPHAEHAGELHPIESEAAFRTHELPEPIAEHAPVNYVAWMQRMAGGETDRTDRTDKTDRTDR